MERHDLTERSRSWVVRAFPGREGGGVPWLPSPAFSVRFANEASCRCGEPITEEAASWRPLQTYFFSFA